MGTQNKRHGSVGNLENQRHTSQLRMDSNKPIEERRKKGQFSTPYELAQEITQYGLTLLGDNKVDFIEPALGTGVFYSALLNLVENKSYISSANGFEIDSDYYDIARRIWAEKKIEICNADFLSLLKPNRKYNLLLTNPPYVRHHYIDKAKKEELKKLVKTELGISISGLSGLYCYFMLLAHKWLAEGAISGWLLPSEFMDVNYGEAVKEYLLDKVHLLRIHRYNPSNCLFDDALVSSCVVWYTNEQIDEDYEIVFSYGGTHEKPERSFSIRKSQAKLIKKWTHIPDENFDDQKINAIPDESVIGDFFEIKRGLATGDNDFFILSREQIRDRNLDMRFFKPILPSPRNMKYDEIMSDEEGNPQIDGQLFLLDCDLTEEEIERRYPKLWQYLCSGLETTATKYLCKSRKKWYFQERREPTAFLCSYMGRGKQDQMPFRFILNHSNAIASNSYLLLYPKENLMKSLSRDKCLYQKVWEALQRISIHDMEGEGRVYGGGLKKIEPKELAKVKCKELEAILL